MAEVDLRRLSDDELKDYLRDLTIRIALLEPHLETSEDRRRRTVKIVRGTILSAGGFLGAEKSPLGFLLVLLGGWDWIEAISDDAKATNKNLVIRRGINALNAELDDVERELRRRNPAP